MASADLAENVAAAVARLRTLDVQKPPGIAEAINWVAALELLGIDLLDGTAVERTLGSVMKYREDLDLVDQRGFRWVATGVGLVAGRDLGTTRMVDIATVAATFGDRLALGRNPGDARNDQGDSPRLSISPRRRPTTTSTGRHGSRSVSGHDQIEQFDRVFGHVFGELADPADTRGDPTCRPVGYAASRAVDSELRQPARRDRARTVG